MLKDQPLLAVDENMVDSSQAAIAIGPLRGDISPHVCPPQTPSVYHGGCDNTVGIWGTCMPDINAEGLENGCHDIYNDSSSLPFHAYGHAPQMPKRPYTPLMTAPPSVNYHGQLYNSQEFPNLDQPYYRQIVSPTIPSVASQTLISRAKFPINIELQGNGNSFGPRPGYLPTWGSFSGRNNLSENSGGFKCLQQGFEGFESSGLWSDWSKHSNRKSSLVHLSSPVACQKPVGSLALSANRCQMAPQPKGSFYGFGSRSASSCKSYPLGQNDRDSGYEVASSSNFGLKGQNWPTLDEARQGGRCNDISCSCTVELDTRSEQNRGPRAFKLRSQVTANAAVDNHSTVAEVYSESYNRLDFVTDYKDAKFFVIKSYSEDNIHKSIKYGVWASTTNGNKKLDAAYREAKEKHGTCPIFLLFSVNASAQFCGVAEMVGPVDFDKSVDFWQQDKWSGQFPVKWHIIKDVPNSQFRHIVLESNDNKPVTNSRDTQEVELQQGIEMLSIFKNHESHSSILDDFHFYEVRQKAMQVRKSRQLSSLVSSPVVGVGENPVSLSNDFIKEMSKSFAEAVSLNEQETASSLSHLPSGTIGIKHEKQS